ncbi:unnamed protein product [Rhizophagus irregularis]|nr:unnamed protein product [Rhizophagus irregularis]CAB5380798.1 unnamed protein product [Rhizophagus irregularis]
MVDNQELSIQTEIFHSLAVVAPKKGQRKFPSLLECATNIERSIRSKNVPKNLISVLINELTNPNQNQADVMFIIQGERLYVKSSILILRSDHFKFMFTFVDTKIF